MGRLRLATLLVLAGCRIGFEPVAGGVDGDGGNGDAIDAAGLTHIEGPGTWTTTPAAPVAARLWTTAVWSGTEFIVYGGALDASYAPTETGARYDPVVNGWAPTTTINAPNKRHTPHLVWAGTRMVTYGGGWGLGPVDGGGSYDPIADRWTVMTASPPGLRIYGTAVAIGSRMLVWGGWANAPGHFQSGFIYDPAADTWTTMSTVGAPTARSMGTSVWTGAKLIVWGGCDGAMGACPGVKGDGAIYDPAADVWSPIASAGGPSARSNHAAVWTGSEMIVFGGATTGNGGGKVNTGAAYNPGSDTWRTISTSGAPSPRLAPGAAWVGDKMVVWGGSAFEADGGLYDPSLDQWSPMATTGAPSGRARFAMAAGGDTVFVWGGSYSDVTGGVWRPESL